MENPFNRENQEKPQGEQQRRIPHPGQTDGTEMLLQTSKGKYSNTKENYNFHYT